MQSETKKYYKKMFSNPVYREQVFNSLTAEQKEVYDILLCAMQLQNLKTIPDKCPAFDLKKLLESDKSVESRLNILFTK